MTRILIPALWALLVGASCGVAHEEGGGRDAVGRAAGRAGDTDAAGGTGQPSLLRNGGFDEGSGRDIAGWEQQGTEYGTASLVASPASSPPRSLRLVAGPRNSNGARSLMVYQVLDAARFRGETLRYGARIRTRGAGVNLTLFTPERASNVLHSDASTGEWTLREGELRVPDNASFLSFGVQIFGAAGSEVWVDDVYVRAAGGGGDAASAASPTAAATAAGSGAAARVTIDAASVSHEASPHVFGMHLEWVENGQGVLHPNRPELRQDVVAALDRLDVPLFRFPGGIHADYYDWRRGAGPPSARGRNLNPFTKKQEAMRFGTPEFVSLLRATGAEAMITANYGTGTPEQAAAWAREFQTLGVTPRYWEVGNEIYLTSPREDQPNGKAIYKSPEAYARDFPRYRDAIRAVLPGAQVGAIAHAETGAFPLAPADNRDWSERMLGALDAPADFVAVHPAYAPVILDDRWDMADAEERDAVYRAMYASTAQVRESLDQVAAAFARSAGGRGRPVRIAVTEFGAFFGLSGKMPIHNAYVDQTRTMGTAVYVASLLDLFLGDPRVFAAAYTNPIHQYFGSLLTDVGGTPVRTPSYFVYELYRTRFEPRIVRTTVAGPTFASRTVGYVRGQSAAPTLLARAGVSADGRRLTAMLVNRSTTQALATTLDVRGFAPRTADCLVLSARSVAAINGPSLTRTVAARSEVLPRALPCAAGASMALEIPANGVVSLVATR